MRSLFTNAWTLVAVLLLGVALPPARSAQGQTGNTGVPKPEVAKLTRGNARAVVLFFIATDCPISNRYLPEMQRTEQEFAGQHVNFWFVYPNLTETAAGMRAHEAAYGAQGQALADPEQQLVRLTGARVTPEAAVLVPQGEALRTVYAGRIDNRYLRLGTERPRATEHDLQAAVSAVLTGRPVPPPGGPPVGCGIVDKQ